MMEEVQQQQPVAAVLYAAKSTDDRRGSIPTQLADCRNLADREGWQVEGEYQDEAFSGFRGNRGPQLAAAKERAAALAAERGCCMLVVQHSDRLARGAGDGPDAADHLAEVWFAMRRRGVHLRSAQDDAYLRDPMGVAMIGQRNTEDSKRKSEATKAGVARRAQRGLYGGGYAPYGYRFERDRNDPSDAGRLVVEPAHAAVVGRIYAAYLAGEGDRPIAASLDADGIRSPRGARWDRATVANILRSPVYVGRVRHLGAEIEGNYEPIVSEADWQQAQALRGARAASASMGRGRPTSGTHLLIDGLLKCGVCGGSLRPRSYPNGRQLYMCRAPGCLGSVERSLVDSAVLGYFEQVALDVEATRAQLAAATSRRLAEARALREQGERELRLAEERLARVRRAFQDGIIEADDWAEQRRDLTDERDAAAAKLKLLRAREADADGEGPLRDLEEELLERLAELRRAVAGQVGSSGDLPAVRAALTRLFDSFTLRRVADVEGPERVGVADVEGPVDLDLALGELYIEPTLRADAVAGYVDVYAEDSGRTVVRPVLRPERLTLPETKRRAARRSPLCFAGDGDGRLTAGAAVLEALFGPIRLGGGTR